MAISPRYPHGRFIKNSIMLRIDQIFSSTVVMEFFLFCQTQNLVKNCLVKWVFELWRTTVYNFVQSIKWLKKGYFRFGFVHIDVKKSDLSRGATQFFEKSIFRGVKHRFFRKKILKNFLGDFFRKNGRKSGGILNSD